MKTKLNIFLIMGCCLLALNSCHRDRYTINISKIKAEVKIERLEDDFFKSDPYAKNLQKASTQSKHQQQKQLPEDELNRR